MSIITPTMNDLIQEGLSLAGQFTNQSDGIWTRASTIWIERVKMEIGKRATWEFLRAAPYSFVTQIPNINSVALPADFLKLDEQQFIGRNQKAACYLNRGGSQYPLDYKDYQYFYQLGDPTQLGFPIYFTANISTFLLYFWQTPDLVYTGTLFYYRNPTKLDTVTDAALLARIVDQWRDLLIQGVYCMALLDKKRSDAPAQFQEWYGMISEQNRYDKDVKAKTFSSAYRDF